ncbi:MAG: OmpA family protein [Nannocystaceae bacterium]
MHTGARSSLLLRGALVGGLAAAACRPPTTATGPASPRGVDVPRVGALESDDRCPDDPEVFNGFDDDDGCPDELLGFGVCEDPSLPQIGGTFGPSPPPCSSGSPPVLLATVDHEADPDAVRRLVQFAGARGAPQERFAPQTVRVQTHDGAPARGAAITYTNSAGRRERVRAGMDGRVVLDRSALPAGSPLAIQWGDSRAEAPMPEPDAALVLPRIDPPPPAPPALQLAVIIDADPEVESEAEALFSALDSVAAALRRSHGLTVQLALTASTGARAELTFRSASPALTATARAEAEAVFHDAVSDALRRERLAHELRRVADLAWAEAGGKVLVVLSRRAPALDSAEANDAVAELRAAGVRVHPILGRAPAAADEAWARWAAATTAGRLHVRTAWGDIKPPADSGAGQCAQVESLTWSLVRALREEVDGVARAPAPGLAYAYRSGAPGEPCEGDGAWRGAGEQIGALRPVYAPGAAEMAAEARPALRRIKAILDELSTLVVVIVGHADGDEVSSEKGRLDLSRRRAAAARARLLDLGVAPERVQIEGMGAATPRDPRSSAEARARNRRLEFKLQTAGPGAPPDRGPRGHSSTCSSPM